MLNQFEYFKEKHYFTVKSLNQYFTKLAGSHFQEFYLFNYHYNLCHFKRYSFDKLRVQNLS